MLLIPFVENSFKHGTLKEGKLIIKSNLQCDGKTLHFYIENTQQRIEMSTTGIGLENIKKRLEFLYKGNYTLQIDNKNDIFKVDLHINLN